MGIRDYDPETLRAFGKKLGVYYEKSLTVGLPFKEFRAVTFNNFYNNPSDNNINLIKSGTRVRIAPPVSVMNKMVQDINDELDAIKRNNPPHIADYEMTKLLKATLKPQLEFDYEIPWTEIEYGGKKVNTPMWFNSSLNKLCLRTGYNNGDSASPSCLTLGDDVVHAMLGGQTGAGKSVALNTIECNLLLEYPPWEVDMYLCDFKKVEASRYANRIKTPHVNAVAATASTEFVVSLFDQLKAELAMRSSLCTACGTQKLADFRNKFDLIVPRVVVIVDEFTQMFENIKTSEALGNDNATEDKRAINSSISELARLGRSFGLHMLLSSQQLDDLDDGIANQFGAGVTLKAPPSVSRSLIGNDAGSTIRGKGKGFINMNKKAENNERFNISTRIPYLSSEQTEEEAASGKLTDLLEILTDCYNKSQALNYDKGLIFYNEDNSIPYQSYLDAVEEAVDYMRRKQCSKEIGDKLFVEKSLAYIPMGPEIKYTSDISYYLNIVADKNTGILIGATEDDDRNYIIRLLFKALSDTLPDAKHTIINADPTITYYSGLNDAPNVNPANVIKKRAMLSADILARVEARQDLLKFYEYISDMSDTHDWSLDIHLGYLSENNPKVLSQLGLTEDRFEEIYTMFEEETLDDATEEEVPEKKDRDTYHSIVELSRRIYGLKTNYLATLENFGTINVQCFRREFIWLIGLENFNNVTGYENKESFASFLSDAGSVGIVPIVTGKQFGKVGQLCSDLTYILDKADRYFYMDVSMQKKININKNSFKITNRLTKEFHIVSYYSGMDKN